MGASATHGRLSCRETADPCGLDYEKIRDYWSRAESSVLGPYMMEGFGFPTSAGLFRFHGERRIVDRMTDGIGSDATVLDLGSGVGLWTEHFARRFERVISVEGSPNLHGMLERRCAGLANVETVEADVLSYEIPDAIGLAFLGGLLMYVEERDARVLVRRLADRLRPGGVILCRESTVGESTVVRKGTYQVVYRSPEVYRKIFADCGLRTISETPNVPYIFAQMICELVRQWRALMPSPLQHVAVVGRLLYWGFRLGYPWNARFIPWVMGRLGLRFPALTNHFFCLRADSSRTVSCG